MSSGLGGDGGGDSMYNDLAVKEETAEGASFAPETTVVEIQESDGEGSRRGGRGGRGDRFAQMEARMLEFDADGDGILNAEEREAMGRSFMNRMNERFDLDGDGVMSIEEQFAARRERMTGSVNRRNRQYDLDGNGEFSEQELAAMNADLDAREAERMAEIVAEYDLDGDGEMSLDETIIMQEQQFADRMARMDSFTSQFDRNGDGGLDADERLDVRDMMVGQREVRRFTEKYDGDGDRQVGASDYERFLEAYQNKDSYADVNGDGC